MSRKKSEQFNFEKSLEDLDKLVNQMEAGDLTLEDSLAQFSQGINLIRHCQTALQEAEQKVRILLEQHGEPILSPYQNENDQ